MATRVFLSHATKPKPPGGFRGKSGSVRGGRTMCKPILAVNPRAQQRSSTIVTNAAAEIVGWTRKSVLDAISRLYRQS